MKSCLIFIAITFSTIQILGQSTDKWTPKHIEVLNNFGSDTADNRGIQLRLNVNSTLKIKDVYAEFFKGTIKKDFYFFELNSVEIPTSFLNKPLGIYEIVDLYLYTQKL